MKYLLSAETRDLEGGGTVHRIVRPNGEKGGFVESEDNLSQAGSCWLFGDSVASGHARIEEDAKLFGFAEGHALARGRCQIFGRIGGDAVIEDDAQVFGSVSGNHRIGGNQIIYGLLD